MTTNAIQFVRINSLISPLFLSPIVSWLYPPFVSLVLIETVARRIFSTSFIEAGILSIVNVINAMSNESQEVMKNCLTAAIQLYSHVGSALFIRACSLNVGPPLIVLVLISIISRLQLGRATASKQHFHAKFFQRFTALSCLRSVYYFQTGVSPSTIVSIGMLFAAFSSGKVLKL